jgi:Met-zincin
MIGTTQLIFVQRTVPHTLCCTHSFPLHSPASIVHVLTGKLILSDTAYAEGIGFFDKVAINYGYRIFTEIDENPSLQRLIDDAEAEGYVFLTDQVRRKEGVSKVV